MSKRIRIYDEQELSAHKTSSSCWVSRNGKVYNISSFLPDHPGGEDIVLNFAGKDIGNVMADKDEHEHSDAAYDMLDEYFIGKLGSTDDIVKEGVCSYLHPYLDCLVLCKEIRLGSYR
jgi:4-hydroxysphinganine ceramide fatty acyl 2-hydroxylase